MAAFVRRTRYRFAGLEETQAWGRALGARLVAGDVIALVGDLGAGKTTLTQAIARGMQIREPVTSPTFALAQEYPGSLPLFHFDPYRLESVDAFADLGFEEYFDRGGVIVVEWADKITALLPEERLTLTFALPEESDVEAEDGAPRAVQAEAVGTRYVALLESLDRENETTAIAGPKT